MNRSSLIAAWMALLISAPLSAQPIYKYIDAQGKVTYSNEPIKGGKKVNLPPISTVTLPKPAALKAPPKTAPDPAAEVDKAQHKKQLQESIANEEQALKKAQLKAKEEDIPELTRSRKTVIGKNGKPTTITEIRDNPGAYEEKMKRLNADITAHEKKLAALKADLQILGDTP